MASAINNHQTKNESAFSIALIFRSRSYNRISLTPLHLANITLQYRSYFYKDELNLLRLITAEIHHQSLHKIIYSKLCVTIMPNSCSKFYLAKEYECLAVIANER